MWLSDVELKIKTIQKSFMSGKLNIVTVDLYFVSDLWNVFKKVY